jgi:hypothetical protein
MTEIVERRDTPILIPFILGIFAEIIEFGFVDEFEEVVVESEFAF